MGKIGQTCLLDNFPVRNFTAKSNLISPMSMPPVAMTQTHSGRSIQIQSYMSILFDDVSITHEGLQQNRPKKPSIGAKKAP